MMKKAIPILILLIAGVAVYFIFIKKEPKQPEGEKQKPLTLEDHSSAFTRSYDNLLTAYMNVKDALVASDTGNASNAARQLITAADSLRVDEIQGDTTGVLKETAKNYSSTISSSALALSMEKDITAKRKEFEMIAEALWNLTRTVRYDGQKLYWQYCPMAFDNRGAYWVSDKSEILNPYFGDEMLHCGSVQDSLDYSKK